MESISSQYKPRGICVIDKKDTLVLNDSVQNSLILFLKTGNGAVALFQLGRVPLRHQSTLENCVCFVTVI